MHNECFGSADVVSIWRRRRFFFDFVQLRDLIVDGEPFSSRELTGLVLRVLCPIKQVIRVARIRHEGVIFGGLLCECCPSQLVKGVLARQKQVFVGRLWIVVGDAELVLSQATVYNLLYCHIVLEFSGRSAVVKPVGCLQSVTLD